MEKRKERGVTLVETVVALALIMIITTSVFFVCRYSIKMQEDSRVEHFFISETENVLMCYYSDNFSKAISFLVGDEVIIDDEADEFTLYYSSEFAYTDSENYNYSLTINYENKSSPIVTCKKNDSEKLIYSFGGGDV